MWIESKRREYIEDALQVGILVNAIVKQTRPILTHIGDLEDDKQMTGEHHRTCLEAGLPLNRRTEGLVATSNSKLPEQGGKCVGREGEI